MRVSVRKMLRQLKRLLNDEDGLEMLEWSIMAAVVALTCSLFYQGLGFRLAGVVVDLSNLF